MKSLLLGACLALACVAGKAQTQPTPSLDEPLTIFRLPLPAEQVRPMMIPTTPSWPTLIELPAPIESWTGRGFTSDTTSDGAIAGDFTLWPADIVGQTRISVTPLVGTANRIIHLILRGGKVLTLDIFVASKPEEAFIRVTFVDDEANTKEADAAAAAERDRRTNVIRAATPPRSAFREPTPATELGLETMMRALVNMPEDMALKTVAANRALQLAKPEQNIIETDDYSIVIRFALRDSITDTMGLCVVLQNKTAREIIFTPDSWVLRAGSMVYPIKTYDFPGLLEPDESRVVLLVLTRGPDGRPTRLLPDSPMSLSLVEDTTLNPKPVTVQPLDNGR